MGTTIAITFPLGRYHATRWDGGANTSDAEWPPSPWRLLRALISVWHTRWPDLPAEEFDDLLRTLGTPVAYRTPDVRPGSTRHYMPDVRHVRATTGNTDQVIDAFLAVHPAQPLGIYWERDLDASQRGTLAKLLEMLPYLGRSESICTAELLDIPSQPDATWWRLGEVGDGIERVELLAPDGAPDRAALEATTLATRKSRRLIPIGSRWIAYGRTSQSREILPQSVDLAPSVEALLFQLSAPVSVRARNAVLATDAMHGLVTSVLTKGRPVPAHVELVGRTESGEVLKDGHAHLHVVAMTASATESQPTRATDIVETILLWAPSGVPSDLAARIAYEARELRVREQLRDGMATQQLLFAGAGSLADLAPEMVATHTDWISAMPYLPVRHRKRSQDEIDFLSRDVAFECQYRGLPVPATVEPVTGDDTAAQIAQFRRRRISDRMDRQRPGVYLRLTFESPLTGPLIIGQLSHFGFGTFVPA